MSEINTRYKPWPPPPVIENEWSKCQGKQSRECPCINFVWKNPTRSTIYTEEDLTQEFSTDYNEKSLVTILNSVPYTSNGRDICYTSLTGPICNSLGCTRRPDGLEICNNLYIPNNLPKLKISYYLEYYEWEYRKCKLSPRRCVCKPHSPNHHCTSYIRHNYSISSSNWKSIAETLATNKIKNNGKYQIGVQISLTHKPSNANDCHMWSKYYGVTMEDFPPITWPWPSWPWLRPISRLNCSYVTSSAIQQPRIRCRELNFHLLSSGVKFEKGRPPIGTPPLIAPIRVPFV